MKLVKSLRFNVWMYFMLFIIIVFVLLWLFQIVFLETFYEKSKIQDVTKVAAKMLDGLDDEDYEDDFHTLAYNNDMCMLVLDKYERIVFSDDFVMGNNCPIHGLNTNVHEFTQAVKSSKSKTIYYKLKNERINTETLLYGTVIGPENNPTGYIFINTPLAPVGSTVTIIKRQMLVITDILIVLGFIISLFVSKMIAKPITKITKSAQKLAEGDYTVEFDGKGYWEVQQLADTLSYASKEISKVDTQQRDLIANVSHDLRTPLTMLKAYAEMIRDLSGDNPTKRAEHLNIIIDETDRLALLVNDMLDLSKLENGGTGLTFSTFGITSKLNEIMDRFKGISEKQGYNIYFEPDEEVEVTCDVVKIEQVIYNLINNAINYTGKDKNVYVKQINMDDGVKIEITDTGDGISEENIKLIFDKYYRSENHKREVVGTGLGLSIVKAILKRHNYAFGVQSTLGKGSTFWFKISTVNVLPPQQKEC